MSTVTDQARVAGPDSGEVAVRDTGGARAPRPIVLGVAGGSGSGKTTVVREIIRELAPVRASVLHHDSYYRDSTDLSLEERSHINYDHPDSLESSLLAAHIRELIEGRSVHVPIYDFKEHRRLSDTRRIDPAPVVIIDGILVLADAELRDLMDIRVYVDTDADLRFIRRLERDMGERRRSLESVIRQYTATVRPMHLQFVGPSRRHAHVIVPEGGRNTVAISMLVARLRTLVARGSLAGGAASRG
ncbi:MAG: uridine kinase [Gemmatimonadota bacterium]